MLNFTLGPVQSFSELLKISGNDAPYFRTDEFSNIMLENERLMLKFSGAPPGSRAVFITGSGTAAMEASVINTLTDDDRALIVNGGSFGARFCKLCDIHGVPYDMVKLESGHTVHMCDLEKFESRKYTSFLINNNETSTGVKYDMNLISSYCKDNGEFLIVDNISSFLCDEFNMEKLGVDVMIVGSQKALACHPGVSIVVLSPRAIERVKRSSIKCMYLNMKSMLEDQDRGQTPFTPAVIVLLQINKRLKDIERNGGLNTEIARVRDLAKYFRAGIQELPLRIYSESLGNALTPVCPINKVSAYDIFLELKNKYDIWVCPNGRELKDKILRVGHIGCLTFKEYDKLFNALRTILQ